MGVAGDAAHGVSMTTVRYPGIPAVADGSEAVGHVETRVAEAACAYPITPSTTMAAIYQAAVADGKTDLWGTALRFVQPESEHSSASAAEGFALAGGRVTNFTAGQGLILMKEVLYVIAGKRLPAVFHVGARALTSQSLNIHCGHDDVMGVADTGWGILFARNAQEVVDLAAIARRVAESAEIPFIVAQDGFLTTHTFENVLLPEDELLREYLGPPRERVRSYFEPADALMTGVVQNQDSYMKGRIGQRGFYHRLAEEVRLAMHEWTGLTGRPYSLIDAYRCEDAETIVVAMGTIADTAIAVVDTLRAAGRRVGCVGLLSFRPFPSARLAATLRSARAIAVIERTDEPAAADNPLTREIKAALADLASDQIAIPRVFSVSAGLGSRDVSAGDIAAVYRWLEQPATAGNRFAVLGVRHPLALQPLAIDVTPRGAYSLRGHSIGGLGAVTTNKLIAALAGDLFGVSVQAYPRYGSEKKGLPTSYFLTLADERIRTHAELDRVHFVALYDAAAFGHGDPLRGLVDGGTVFVQSTVADPQALWSSIAPDVRARITARGIRVAALDTAGLARRHSPRPDLIVRMQGIALVGVFLRLTPFAARASLEGEDLMREVRIRLLRFFGKRGELVVDANLALIREAYEGVIDVTGALAPDRTTAAQREAVA
jgi:pyruvate-ferredoxin/flavodoxin oxidoreductase